mgnify:CR=1 FL=1
MFTKNAEQRNVMCMMDKEMRMYMCMSNCGNFLWHQRIRVMQSE